MCRQGRKSLISSCYAIFVDTGLYNAYCFYITLAVSEWITYGEVEGVVTSPSGMDQWPRFSGEEAISTSIKAAAVGFAIIVIFMIAVYHLLGLAASLALALYVELIVILLDAFEITLTLPGIAGIILSIGMAVDANVIIFARIREEIAKG